MNNKQLRDKTTKLFDGIKKDQNGNVSLPANLSINKTGGLSVKVYPQIAIGFFREYRRNLAHNGSSVSFDAICETLSGKVDFEQILAFRFVKTGETKTGEPTYTKVNYNKKERAERIRAFSNRLKKHFAPAFGLSSAQLSGINFGVDDMQAIIKSAARMVVRVSNPYVAPQKVAAVIKSDGKKVEPSKNKTTNRKPQPAATV
jgi:ribosomal protein L21